MLFRTLKLLKANPILILIYIGYIVLTGVIMFTLYPWDMNAYSSVSADPADMMNIGITLIKMLLSLLLISILGLLFISGYGGMITEALNTGRTSAASFLPGIKHYFVRVLLATLLMMAFALVFTVVLTMLMIPLAILAISEPILFTMVFTGFVLLVTAVGMPFIILWTPALFIDDVGVIQSMKNGAKAGLKYYWQLFLIILAMYLPAPIGMIGNDYSTGGTLLTPGYIAMLVLTVLISQVTLPLIFVVYKAYQDRYHRKSPSSFMN